MERRPVGLPASEPPPPPGFSIYVVCGAVLGSCSEGRRAGRQGHAAGPGDRAANTLRRGPEAQRALRWGMSIARGPEATPGALAAASADTGVSCCWGRELRRQAESLGRSEDEPDSRPLGDTALCMACIGTPGFAGHHRGGSPAGLCWVAGWRGRKKGMRLGLREPTFWRVRRTTSPNTEAGLHALEGGWCPWLVSRSPLLGAGAGPSTSLLVRVQGR